MSVLILSPDDHAAHSLESALGRRRITHARDADALPRHEALVLVLDVAINDYQSTLATFREESPWSRCFLIADRGADSTAELAPTIRKPFDASAVAEMLERETELAALDRRRRTLAVRADELGLLLESSQEALVGLDDRGRIVFWNRGAQRTYGFTESEALGMDSTLLGDASPTVVTNVPRSEPETREVRRRHKDGRRLRVIVSRSRAADITSGSRIECVEVSLDVTERRAFEQEFEHSQRLAQLGRMAATLSHEVNNPLAVIRSNTGWLAAMARRDGNSELGEVAADLELASERIAIFVDQMTGFSRRGAPRLVTTSLTKCLGLALRMIRPRAESQRVTVIHEALEMNRIEVAHEPTRFAHAVINVLSNAVDSAAHGGRHVWLKVSHDEHWVTVQVDDDGPGVAEEDRERIFEPFFTTKPLGAGTGLGLWLTKQVLTDHGGEIRVESPPAGGARVKLTLPRRARG